MWIRSSAIAALLALLATAAQAQIISSPTTGGSVIGACGASTNQLLYDNGGVCAGLATANSGLLVTSSGGAPSISTTMPNSIALGTPASGTLTNATGLPISTGVSGLGTGVATLLGGASSGTGGPAGTTSPTFTTPTLGAASATTVNKITLTAPATGSTLTLTDGKTLSVTNTLTLSGTDSTTMTFPTTSATIARTDAANTFTGSQTFSGQIVTTTGTPTIGSGNCGTGSNGAVVAGSTNQSGQITIGASATTTCQLSWSTTLGSAPKACVFFPMNATAAATGTTVARVGAPSTTSVTLTGSALASANYAYICL